MAAGRRREVQSEFAGRIAFSRRSFLLVPEAGQRPLFTDYVVSHRRAAAAQAPDLGFAIPDVGQPYPGSSLPAQQVAIRVQSTHPERIDALEDALFRASFVDLADIAAPDVLQRCARLAGLPEELVEAALDDNALAQQATAEHVEGAKLGVTGIPALLIPGQAPVVGAVPTDAYRAMLTRALDAD